jgi:uncharacterized membrane protein
MPDEGPRELEGDGTEANSATRVGPTGWPSGPLPVAGPRSRPPAGGRPRTRYLAPWLIAALVFAVYLTISLFRYLQLNPLSWDLGIFAEAVKQYAHLRAPVADVRGPGFNLLGDHFSPIIALIAPFFLIAPSPITLLVVQALLTAVSVLPVSWAAADKLGRRAGAAIGAAYGFSWGLQQMINFDFHEIAFAVPLLAFSLSALIRGRTRAAVAWALPLVFVKEDQGFTVAVIGILMIIITRWQAAPGRRPAGPDGSRSDGQASARTAIIGGQLLIVWGIAWSVLAITVIVPHFNAGHQYQYWSDGGTLSPGGHLSAAGLVRQFFTSWPVKLQTTLLLLLPTMFIALWSPLALVALPSIVLRFLGTSPNFWGTQWHYNATVMPILFLAAVDAIARTRARRSRAAATAVPETAALDTAAPETVALDTAALDRAAAETGVAATGVAAGQRASWYAAALTEIDRHGAAAMLAVAAALTFQFPVGTLLTPATYRISPHVADANAAMAKVPDGATVTTTLDLLAPLAVRTDTFWIGNSGNPATEYIVFDGTDSGYSPEPANVPAFVASQHPGVTYSMIYDTGGVFVFHRSGP